MASTVTWTTLSAYTWNQVALGTWDDPLPYPLVRSRNQGAQVTDATSHVISLPAGVQVGDLLYVAFSIDTATTVTSTTSTGWQKLISDKQGASTNQTGEVWWKRATGSDAFTITSSTAEQSTHISIAIQNAADPEAVSANGAAVASYTPPAITPTGGSSNYLTIISGHTDSSAGTTQNFGTAAGYSNSTTQQASTTTSAATNTQEQTYTGVTTVTPGAVTLSLSEQWVAITTAIRRATSSGAPTVQGSVTLTATPTLTVSGAVARPPDVFFDLSNWKLTVPYDGPDGDTNADEIIQPALSTYVDPTYFYLDPSNQMVLDAPVNGDTTSGSTGVRAELREMDGAVESAWDKRTASRQLTVSGYYDPTNITGGSAPKKVGIVGQIHETGGTPGIYLTVDYDAVPSRLRLFKDGPGVGNLVTGFVPTDRLSFRIECTGGNVNIYGSIGDETTLPAIPQFTFPASGFVEPTGSYLKTGAYNKTDTATGSTGDFLVKIVYLNLNQALPVTQPATLSLTATPTLTVNALRTALATVSLIATPTASINATRITPATVSLTATPTFTTAAFLTGFASVLLSATPTLSVTGVRTAVSSVSLTAAPTLSVAIQRVTFGAISLTATPTLSVDVTVVKLASLSLTITPSISTSIQLPTASVSLVATPTLSFIAVVIKFASVSLIGIPTLSVNLLPSGASLTLIATTTISVDAIRVAPSTTLLTIIPTLTLSEARVTFAALNLTVTPTISVSGIVSKIAALSLFITPTLQASAAPSGAAVALLISPTISLSVSYIGAVTVQLTASPSLIISAGGAASAAVSLSILPTVTIAGVIVRPAAITLSIQPIVSIDAVRFVLGSLALTVEPTLYANAVVISGTTLSLVITPTISILAEIITPGAVYLLIVPTYKFRAAIVGAGPGWPIVFRVVSVDNGDEPVSSTQTEFKPSFSLQAADEETTGSVTVRKPYISFQVQ